MKNFCTKNTAVKYILNGKYSKQSNVNKMNIKYIIPILLSYAIFGS